MQQNSEQIETVLETMQYLVGSSANILNMKSVAVKSVFDERMVGFLATLSKRLMHMPEAKQYSDVMSYAFWIRKTSILQEKERFGEKNKLGRGIAFHIAPSNVAVNFAVSFTSALLAGNPCIVRVSSKEFKQVDIITQALNDVMEDEYVDMKNYLVIVRYQHNEQINEILSDMCDIRVVWGGNRTLYEVRKASLPLRAIEMAFPDRHSMAVINADEYLKADAKKVADLFYVDTYFTDQNACSSPRLIVWTGKQIQEAKEQFYQTLTDKLVNEYEMAPILAIDKWNAFCQLAASHTGITIHGDKNVLLRVSVQKLTEDLMEYKMGGGFFFEYETNDLSDVIPILKKECQTISYLGIKPEDIYQIVVENGVRGVDRIVPMGHTMDLSFIWDGYHMIDAMSRYVDVHKY